MVSDDDLRDEISKLHWFHSIELRPGVVTKGSKPLNLLNSEFGAVFGPLDLKSKSVLDVGAWSGAFSVEAHRRGARKVTALDSYVWNNPVLQGRKTFDIVIRETGLKIDAIDRDIDTPMISFKDLGEFDVTLFLGVFYHLKDPLAALRELCSVTKTTMVVETYIENRLPAEPPQMMFYPGSELNGDGSNWWGPNASCIKALLKLNGFSRIDAQKGSAPNRGVFHAYRS